MTTERKRVDVTNIVQAHEIYDAYDAGLPIDGWFVEYYEISEQYDPETGVVTNVWGYADFYREVTE